MEKNTEKIYKYYSEENKLKNIFFRKDNFDFNKNNTKSKIKKSKNRPPGSFGDIESIKKNENNISIIHACKLLKAYYNEEGINALILDGKQMRTTQKLEFLGDRLKKIIIVEYNKDTYEEILSKIKSKKYIIKCYKGHINDFIEKYNDPKINVVYFDVNSNFFSSKTSYGSDFPINEFLSKSIVNELVFAATFCLRTSEKINFDVQVNKILLLLEKIFGSNGFNHKQLINKKDMRYKGQKGKNKALMYVIYFLNKNNHDNDEENNKFDNEDKKEYDYENNNE